MEESIKSTSVQKSVNDDFSAGINVQRRGKFFQRAECMDLNNSGKEEKNEWKLVNKENTFQDGLEFLIKWKKGRLNNMKAG